MCFFHFSFCFSCFLSATLLKILCSNFSEILGRGWRRRYRHQNRRHHHRMSLLWRYSTIAASHPLQTIIFFMPSLPAVGIKRHGVFRWSMLSVHLLTPVSHDVSICVLIGGTRWNLADILIGLTSTLTSPYYAGFFDSMTISYNSGNTCVFCLCHTLSLCCIVTLAVVR